MSEFHSLGEERPATPEMAFGGGKKYLTSEDKLSPFTRQHVGLQEEQKQELHCLKKIPIIGGNPVSCAFFDLGELSRIAPSRISRGLST